jgi:hypothetical protein
MSSNSRVILQRRDSITSSEASGSLRGEESRGQESLGLMGGSSVRRGSMSPSRLNQELNRILETERMIKEYKDIITKMQRDLYSKKQSERKERARSP